MLGGIHVHATLGVKDLGEAKKFYEQTLGLTKTDENPGGVMYGMGMSKVFVYPTQFAGTNQATVASWEVDNVVEVVEALRAKGVSFEHYEIEGVSLDGDIHVMGPMKVAWFKDPSGNVLCVGNAM